MDFLELNYYLESVMVKRVEIAVTEKLGYERVNIPIRVSLPFAQGELFDISNTRLLGANEDELPSQMRTLSIWPDGSVRWLWVFWQAGAAAFDRTVFVLEYGPDVLKGGIRYSAHSSSTRG